MLYYDRLYLKKCRERKKHLLTFYFSFICSVQLKHLLLEACSIHSYSIIGGASNSEKGSDLEQIAKETNTMWRIVQLPLSLR